MAWTGFGSVAAEQTLPDRLVLRSFFQGHPLKQVSRKIYNRRPSRLESRFERKLRRFKPKSYYINGNKSFFKRSVEQDVDIRGETFAYGYNDAQIQQRFANYILEWFFYY